MDRPSGVDVRVLSNAGRDPLSPATTVTPCRLAIKLGARPLMFDLCLKCHLIRLRGASTMTPRVSRTLRIG